MTIARYPVRDGGVAGQENNMSYNADPAIPAAVVLAVAFGVFAIVVVAALLLGLCRAAADTREVEPDTGEYE